MGLSGEEEDLFEKLERSGTLSRAFKEKLKEMKGFRNILVQEYGEVDDRIVYHAVKNRLNDFNAFKQKTLKALPKTSAC